VYFLINYNRRDAKLVCITEYADSAVATKAKLESEIEALNGDVKNEIVILEADSLAALKDSHGRYFNDLTNIRMK